MDEKRLREIYGPAKEKAAAKILTKLDRHCVSFIENSSFVIIGTLNDQNVDAEENRMVKSSGRETASSRILSTGSTTCEVAKSQNNYISV